MQASHLTQQTAPLSRAIAERTIELDRSAVPDDVWEYLKLCLADAVGIAFASRHYEFAQKSLDSLALLGSAGQFLSRGPARATTTPTITPRGSIPTTSRASRPPWPG